MTTWTVRPLADAPLIPLGDRRSPFHAPWTGTLALLAAELDYLRAERVLLELETTTPAEANPADLGALTVPGGPRVRLSFDSRHGPLSYALARYGADAPGTGWRHNIRAIALGLEALRRVDRYGIATRGEQYAGWITAPAGEPATSAAVLVELAGTPGVTPTAVVADVQTYRRTYAAAARRHDPDAGGDLAAWHRLQRARTVLADHHRSQP